MTLFADIFCGIGGFRLAGESLGWECVFSSDISKTARETYKINFGEYPSGDITKIVSTDIPDLDVLCGGFPCQSFSLSGKKLGFNEARGTLFFDVARIISEKRPKAFFLENVRNLVAHDGGRTFATIKGILVGMGYTFDYQIVKASEHGLPQHRPRTFMVGFDRNLYGDIRFEFPEKRPLEKTMSDILGGKCDREIGLTVRCGGLRSGVHDKHNWDGYIVDGQEVYLDSSHCREMMGFPKDYVIFGSETEQKKQLGNSVAVPAIAATMQSMKVILSSVERFEITRQAADNFRLALKNGSKPDDVHPVMWKAYLDGLQSQLDSLCREMADFEKGD